MITKKLVFDHRGRTKEKNEGPIELRVTVNSKPYYINTGVRVRSDQFNGERVVNHRDARLLNERLKDVVMNIELAVNECIKKELPIDVAQIKRQAYNVEEKAKHNETAMIDWIDEQIPQLNIKSGTRERYCVTHWDSWLHKIKKPVSNGDVQAGRDGMYIGEAAVYNYHRTLRSLLSRAVKLGVIEANVYDRMRGEFHKGIKENVEYLTEDEISAIESLRPLDGTQMAMARDLFVFQMYTGLSYSDAQAFDIRDYKKVDGKWVNVGERIKTGVSYVSVLLPQAVDVLERYGWQVPKVNNIQYNASLKVIQQALGIRTKLHSHLARHTFATRALRLGAKIENVSRMLGHTNITQTQKYAKVLAQSVHDDFELINEKLNNNEK